MRRLSLAPAALLFAALFFAPDARADLLPEGHKGVRLSIAVEAEVPAGKALILANTFRGADVITPGAAQEVEWHPLGGDMQLRLVDAAEVPAIVAAREGLDRDTIRPLVERGAACSEPIAGVRTIPESAPYDELRWRYRVRFTGGGCAAELIDTERLKRDDAAAEPDAPRAPDPDPAPAEAAAPSPGPAPARAPAAPPPAAPGGCGCTSAGTPPTAGLLGLGLVVAALRRPRRRAPC